MKKWSYIFVSILFLCVASQCIPSSYQDSDHLCVPAKQLDWSRLAPYNSSIALPIEEALFIEAYVISTAEQGQFYGELIIQDRNEYPSKAMRILTDAAHIESVYPRGSWVRINLQGLYIQYKNQSYTLGEAMASFGNIILGRIPTLDLKARITRLCDSKPLQPSLTRLEELDQRPLNSLVQLDSMRFNRLDSLLTFSNPDQETMRYLWDCNRDSIPLITSNYATFASAHLPQLMGSIVAVYKQNNSGTYLELARLNDLNFNQEVCNPPPLYQSSDQIFISEWADPSNELNARFIELYNASQEPISLNGWALVRYTNANTEAGVRLSLEHQLIEAQSVLVIASNVEVFKQVYGFEPDLVASSSSVAGSNGDDQALLIDPFGQVIDQFGVIGEDGTGTNHDFEDGKALRKSSIVKASSTYDPSQWLLYNKRGAEGTIPQSLIAPSDYSPGTHPD